MARLNKALDEVRAEEHRRMKRDGYEPLLTKARWLLLKRPGTFDRETGDKVTGFNSV